MVSVCLWATARQKRDAWAGLRAQLSSPMTWMLIATTVCAFWFPSMLNNMGKKEQPCTHDMTGSSCPSGRVAPALVELLNDPHIYATPREGVCLSNLWSLDGCGVIDGCR